MSLYFPSYPETGKKKGIHYNVKHKYMHSIISTESLIVIDIKLLLEQVTHLLVIKWSILVFVVHRVQREVFFISHWGHWEWMGSELANEFQLKISQQNYIVYCVAFIPGYFPPLLLLIKQTMSRMRMRSAMAHMSPMNQPCVAMSTWSVL